MMLTPDMLAQGFQMMSSTPFYLGTQFINGYSQAMGGPTFNDRFYGASVGVNEQTAAAFNLPSPAMLQARAATMAPALITPMATNPYRTLRPVPTMSFLNVLKPEYMGMGYARTMLPTEAYMEAQSQFPAATLQMLNNFGISGLGTVVGGALGSLIPIPGVGTFLGAALGNLAGLGLGQGVENIMALPDVMVTRQIANRLFRNREERPYTPIPMSQASDILNEIIKTARTEPVFNTEDVKKLFTEISQSNLMTDAQYTVDQFKRDFKQLIETNRLVSQALKTSTEDALEIMKGFANVGISDTAQMQQIAFANRQAAWTTGTTEEFQMQQSTGLMQIGNQMGLYGQALGLITMAGNNLTSYMVNEVPNADQFVAAMGGAGRVGQAASLLTEAMLTNPQFTNILLGAVTGGGNTINLETIQKVIQGEINPMELEAMGTAVSAKEFLNTPQARMDYISQMMLENPNAIPLDAQAALFPALTGSFIQFLLSTSNGNENMVVDQLVRMGFGNPQFVRQIVSEVGRTGSTAFVGTAIENTRMAEIERIANANLAFEQIPFTKRIENTIQSFMDVFREARTNLLKFFEDVGSTYYGRRVPDWTTFNRNMGNYGLGLTGEELTTSYYQEFFMPENLEQLRMNRQQYEKAIEEGRLNFFGIEFETEDIIQKFNDFINNTITQFTGTENMTQQEYETITRELEAQGVTTLENYQNQVIDIETATRETTQIELLKEIVDALAEGNLDNKDLKTKIQQFLIANANDPDAINKLYAKFDELMGTIEEPSLSLQRNTEEIKDMIQGTATTTQYFQYSQRTPFMERQAEVTQLFPGENKPIDILTAMTVAEFANRDLTGLTQEQQKELYTDYFTQLYTTAYFGPPTRQDLKQFEEFVAQYPNFNEISSVALERLNQPDASKMVSNITRNLRINYNEAIKRYNKLIPQEYQIPQNEEGNYVPNIKSLQKIVDIYTSEGVEAPLEDVILKATTFEQELLNQGLDIYSLAKIQQEFFPEQANLTLEEFWDYTQNEENRVNLDRLKRRADLRNYAPVSLFNTMTFEEALIPKATQIYYDAMKVYSNKAYRDIFMSAMTSEAFKEVNAEDFPERQAQLYELFYSSFTNPERASELLAAFEAENIAQSNIQTALIPVYEQMYEKFGYTVPENLDLRGLIYNPINEEIQKQITTQTQNVAMNYMEMANTGQITEGQALALRYVAGLSELASGGITGEEYKTFVNTFKFGEPYKATENLMLIEGIDEDLVRQMGVYATDIKILGGAGLVRQNLNEPIFSEQDILNLANTTLGYFETSSLLENKVGKTGEVTTTEDLLSASITDFSSSTETFSQATVRFNDSIDNYTRKINDQIIQMNQLIDNVAGLNEKLPGNIPATVAG